MYKKMNIIEKNLNKILRQLFLKPNYRFHIRELARLTGLNPNTVISLIKELEKEKIINREKKKNVVEIKLEFDNQKVVHLKKIFNLIQIYESGIVDELVNYYAPSLISLVGSYSRGEDIEKSDIDIVIISANRKMIEIERFEKKLGRRLLNLSILNKILKLFHFLNIHKGFHHLSNY
jgi:predicted nucleotidyltransferase